VHWRSYSAATSIEQRWIISRQRLDRNRQRVIG
jgi:hypothetical protein